MTGKIKYIFSLTACLFFATSAIDAQMSFIDGRAYYYPGKEVNLYSFSDLITYTQLKESTDTVDTAGVFHLEAYVTRPQVFNVKIDNQIGKLYMLYSYKYGVVFPPPQAVTQDVYQNPNAEYSVDLLINGDSTELNARIIDFNQQFDLFWEKNYKYFVAKRIQNKLDSFEMAMNKRYENVNSSYLKTYVKYTFALINNNIGRHRNYIAAKYILGQPINYGNYEYMEFFNQFFKLYLQKQTIGKYGNDLLDNINGTPNFKALKQTMKNDPWLASSDSLCELVALKGLYELYYTPDFSKANIIAMVSEVKTSTKNEEHKKIADNMLHIFLNLQVGAEAPYFALNDASGKLHQLTDFAGRYIYLEFFSPKSIQSQQEMKKLEEIKNKYSDKVTFISICIDGTEQEFKEFVKKNPKYNWLLLYGAKEKKLLDAYIIKVPATYYFINQEGYLVQSPATLPSEGIEFKFKEMFRPRSRR